ncbi:hypothetical protein GUJ93_ZPchr0010g7964 [Zizania palustris]|uniref:AP complex mu/sigma subunit domain-containing protein n=1 Tax=Zizania palustris TaxID=103762 RepID=A0A8J5WBS9_ZIZPA|nr:hypothetical protein GUJ93_ZPchr0010g7964 [Zizania palustris]
MIHGACNTPTAQLSRNPDHVGDIVQKDRTGVQRLKKPWEEGGREGEAMGIRFVLFVNKQGQTRLAQYYEQLSIDERRALEGEIVRKCLARTDQQCSFVEHRSYKVVYRRYASLFFLVGVSNDENELAILEFIHLFVETMDHLFGNVCELDIMFHLEKILSHNSPISCKNQVAPFPFHQADVLLSMGCTSNFHSYILNQCQCSQPNRHRKPLTPSTQISRSGRRK